ncbi:MAG: hypothetical protein KDA84_13675 [Planctomycetaceae bacterium]|nr:hypothetical protein [Planctomycetaceae bacterium]
MKTFDELVTSRKRWIDEVLAPWCRQACRKDLIRAAMDWGDIAGRVDENATLWTWAWSRFPALIHEGLAGVNKTGAVQVRLKTGESFNGFPDARESTNGQLVLIPLTGTNAAMGPFSIDDIADVQPASMDSA